MTQPLVACVMLAQIGRREDMQRRARNAFHGQVYANKILIEWENSASKTIGAYRNEVMAWTLSQRKWSPSAPDIIAHWDDDDWSGPQRLVEQVALLQSSGADVVGYNEMLFWRETGETWRYCSPNPSCALGTSLCYWRETWARKPFRDTSQGEDHAWLLGLNVVAVSSLPKPCCPRMIATIHGGNTSNSYHPRNLRPPEWHREPDYDSDVRWIMEEAMKPKPIQDHPLPPAAPEPPKTALAMRTDGGAETEPPVTGAPPPPSAS